MAKVTRRVLAVFYLFLSSIIAVIMSGFLYLNSIFLKSCAQQSGEELGAPVDTPRSYPPIIPQDPVTNPLPNDNINPDIGNGQTTGVKPITKTMLQTVFEGDYEALVEKEFYLLFIEDADRTYHFNSSVTNIDQLEQTVADFDSPIFSDHAEAIYCLWNEVQNDETIGFIPPEYNCNPYFQ